MLVTSNQCVRINKLILIEFLKIMSAGKAPKTSHYVYLLRCADDSLYCGYATDVARRVREHNGEGKLKVLNIQLAGDLLRSSITKLFLPAVLLCNVKQG